MKILPVTFLETYSGLSRFLVVGTGFWMSCFCTAALAAQARVTVSRPTRSYSTRTAVDGNAVCQLNASKKS